MRTIATFAATLVMGATFLSSVPSIFAQSVTEQVSTEGISYINGGIGYEEAQHLEALAKRYPLWLLFSEGECGRAVSNVDVSIKSKSGDTVFTLGHAGPQLLVNLPKGSYKVTARHEQKDQGARFTLSGSGNQKVVLNWKNCVEEDSLDLPEKEAN